MSHQNRIHCTRCSVVIHPWMTECTACKEEERRIMARKASTQGMASHCSDSSQMQKPNEKTGAALAGSHMSGTTQKFAADSGRTTFDRRKCCGCASSVPDNAKRTRHGEPVCNSCAPLLAPGFNPQTSETPSKPAVARSASSSATATATAATTTTTTAPSTKNSAAVSPQPSQQEATAYADSAADIARAEAAMLQSAVGLTSVVSDGSSSISSSSNDNNNSAAEISTSPSQSQSQSPSQSTSTVSTLVQAPGVNTSGERKPRISADPVKEKIIGARGTRACARCGIINLNKYYVVPDTEEALCDACFVCKRCGEPVGEEAFVRRKQPTEEGVSAGIDDFIHQRCLPQEVCAACKKPLTGAYVMPHDSKIHPECFTCVGCAASLSGVRFFVIDGKNYCSTCEKTVD